MTWAEKAVPALRSGLPRTKLTLNVFAIIYLLPNKYANCRSGSLFKYIHRKVINDFLKQIFRVAFPSRYVDTCGLVEKMCHRLKIRSRDSEFTTHYRRSYLVKQWVGNTKIASIRISPLRRVFHTRLTLNSKVNAVSKAINFSPWLVSPARTHKFIGN